MFLLVINCYCSVVWHFDVKCMHVELIMLLTEICERMYRAKSTFESDLRTHTNTIFKMAYNEIRLTTIIFQPQDMPFNIKKL